MADEPNVTPPVDAAPGSTPDTTSADTPDYQKQVSELQVQLQQQTAQHETKVAEQTQLLQQYQVALGDVRKQQTQTTQAPPKEPQVEAGQYDEGTLQYVTQIASKVAKQIVDKKTVELVTNADNTSKLGDDKDIREAAQAEYASLKQNPAYQNLDDYLIQKMAIDAARSQVFEKRSTEIQAELSKMKESDLTANTTSLPSTGTPSFQQRTVDPNNPDADVKEWEAQPENQLMFRKFIERPHADITSNEKIRWYGQQREIKDIYRDFAIRAVRKGVALGGASGMAVQEWTNRLGGGVR